MSWTKATSALILLFLLLGCVPPKRPVEVPPRPPEGARERVLRGLEAWRAGRLEEAVRDLEAVRYLRAPSPEGEEALYALGMASFRLGDYGKAAAAFRDFLRLYPRSPRAREVKLQLVRALREKGDLEGATALAEEVLREGALGPEGREELLWFLARGLREDRPMEALGYYQALLELGEGKAREEALSLLSGLKGRELQEAAKSLRGDLRTYALLLLAGHWIREGETERAQEVLEGIREEAEARGFGGMLEALWSELMERVGKEVRIGVVVPLSGKLAHRGRSFLQGVLLGAGVLGPRRFPYKVEVLVEDAEEGASALEGLKGEVQATLALLPTQGVEGVMVAGQAHGEGALGSLLEEARREGIRDLALLYPATPRGRALAVLAQQEAGERGLRVVLLRGYDPGTVDFGPVIGGLKDWPSLPQGLLLLEDGETLCLVASQLAYLDLLGIRVLGLGVEDPERLRELCGRYLDGAIITSPFYPRSRRPEVAAFLREFREAYHRDPDPLAFEGYRMARSVLEGGEGLPPFFLLKVENGRILEIP